MSKTPSKHLLGYVVVALGAFLYFHLPRPISRDPVAAPPAPSSSTPSIPVAVKPATSDSPKPDPCESLYQVVCGHRSIIEDPTGVVEPDVKGEVDALRLYEKLLHEHPATSEEVDEKIVAILYTPKRRKHLQDVFDWVRKTMIRRIENEPNRVFSLAAKTELVRLLHQTELELPPPASRYKDELDVFTKNDVFYETLSDGRRVIRVGGAYLLTAKSWFNRVFTFAHELAHAIDPCDADPAAPYLPEYARVERCFLKHGLVKRKHDTVVCGAGDQLSESFADWMGAQITAEALKSFGPRFKSPQEILNAVSNSVRDLCQEETWLEYNTESYPEPSVRIQTIFGRNPEIRKILGCIKSPGDPAEKPADRLVAGKPSENYSPAYCSFGGT